MATDADLERDPLVDEVAAALQVGVRLLVRRLRQVPAPGELSGPETSALARLDRGGPSTSADLARLERISPQSMGATLQGLQSRGLIARESDPHDGRRVVLRITDAGTGVLAEQRSARAEKLAAALAAGFTRAELKQLQSASPLLERLAQTL